MDKWLDSWNQVYTTAVKENIPEVSGIRSIRDFLAAIKSTDPSFSAAYSVVLNRDKPIDMFDLVKQFK